MHSLRVSLIDPSIAAPFIRKWHYSKKFPRGSHVCFGWFVDKLLYAVADYGNGVGPYQAQACARLTTENVTINNLVELKRLCRIEPKISTLQLTQFLARCHRLLKTIGYLFVVSYSDPSQGHNGGIYRAANFQWLGQTDSEAHVIDQEGTIHHKLYAQRYAENNNITVAQARKVLGLKRVILPPKDRWFFRLNGQKIKKTLFMELDLE